MREYRIGFRGLKTAPESKLRHCWPKSEITSDLKPTIRCKNGFDLPGQKKPLFE
jgi:hypothetical protein